MIKTLLFDLAEEYPFFGYKKLTHLLRSRFRLIINKKKVYRLCQEMDLLLPVARYVSNNSGDKIVFEKVPVTAPNTHWQMDITYITLFPRILFLLDIIDTYTLEIVGYKVGFSITSKEVVKTVLKALTLRKVAKGLTIRTDNGPQFKSREFQEFCTKQGIFHERIPIKSPERNPNIERFHRTFKEEFVNLHDFNNYKAFFEGTDKYMEFYNNERPHESLKYLTPGAFYEEFQRNNASRGVLVV